MTLGCHATPCCTHGVHAVVWDGIALCCVDRESIARLIEKAGENSGATPEGNPTPPLAPPRADRSSTYGA